MTMLNHPNKPNILIPSLPDVCQIRVFRAYMWIIVVKSTQKHIMTTFLYTSSSSHFYNFFLQVQMVSSTVWSCGRERWFILTKLFLKLWSIQNAPYSKWTFSPNRHFLLSIQSVNVMKCHFGSGLIFSDSLQTLVHRLPAFFLFLGK